jgi:outer membrane biosynthesis protein TonB
MKRTLSAPLAVLLLLITAHRLPAPIHEIPENPTPVPTVAPTAQPKEPPLSKPKPKTNGADRNTTAVAKTTPHAQPSIANDAGLDFKPYVIASPEVVFPAVLKRTLPEGATYNGTFRVAIDPRDGSVTEVKVLKHTGVRQLDAIYVMNLFQWKFRPGTITSATIPRSAHRYR